VNEIWKPHPVYGDLVQASSLGRVRQFDFKAQQWHVLKQREHKKGYMMVNLRKPLFVCGKKVHQLVAEAWYGNRSSALDVAHKDGNKENNRPDNLVICSRRANSLHKRAHGMWACPVMEACQKALQQRARFRWRNCLGCGNTFSGTWKTQGFCSAACKQRAAERRRPSRHRPGRPWRRWKLQLICRACGSAFTAPRKRIYCSKACCEVGAAAQWRLAMERRGTSK